MIGSVVQFAAISLLLGIGSYMDIKTREIPNWISVIIALTAVINFRLDNLWGIIVAVIFFPWRSLREKSAEVMLN